MISAVDTNIFLYVLLDDPAFEDEPVLVDQSVRGCADRSMDATARQARRTGRVLRRRQHKWQGVRGAGPVSNFDEGVDRHNPLSARRSPAR